MIAAHLESLLFLLLVAVAVLFQFLAKAAGKTGKDQTSDIDTDSKNAYANAARADRVRRRPDSQIIGSPWPTSNFETAAARGASDRYSAPPTCTGAAADFTVFATKTRKVAQARDNPERNSSVAECQRRGKNGSTHLRSSRRTIAHCAAADLQSACENLRGRDADNC